MTMATLRPAYPYAIGCIGCQASAKRHCPSSPTCSWFWCPACPLMMETQYRTVSAGGIGNARFTPVKLFIRKQAPWGPLEEAS